MALAELAQAPVTDLVALIDSAEAVRGAVQPRCPRCHSKQFVIIVKTQTFRCPHCGIRGRGQNDFERLRFLITQPVHPYESMLGFTDRLYQCDHPRHVLERRGREYRLTIRECERFRECEGCWQSWYLPQLSHYAEIIHDHLSFVWETSKSNLDTLHRRLRRSANRYVRFPQADRTIYYTETHEGLPDDAEPVNLSGENWFRPRNQHGTFGRVMMDLYGRRDATGNPSASRGWGFAISSGRDLHVVSDSHRPTDGDDDGWEEMGLQDAKRLLSRVAEFGGVEDGDHEVLARGRSWSLPPDIEQWKFENAAGVYSKSEEHVVHERGRDALRKALARLSDRSATGQRTMGR